MAVGYSTFTQMFEVDSWKTFKWLIASLTQHQVIALI
jgi:hypothetical protein